MRIKKRIRKSYRQNIFVVLLCIVVIGGAAVFTCIFFTDQIRYYYVSQLNEANYVIEQNQKVIYVASTDIMPGDYITKENIERISVFTSQSEKVFISQDDIGKLALINIPEGTHITNMMLTENVVASQVREVAYNMIHISSNIWSNDTVDLRISYPNGETYIVLSKKIVQKLDTDTSTCIFWLDEEELLRMSAAIVDAGLYSGTKLYLTKYIEPNIQGASIVNYTPSLSILTLIENDPNIVDRCSQKLNKDLRKALENRLADNMELDVSEISWDINSNLFTFSDDTKKNNTNSLEKVNEERGISNEMEDKEIESDYLIYIQEERAKEGEIEYGE